MNVKNIAVLAVLLSCLAVTGGAMLMDSEEADAADSTYNLSTDSVKVGVSYTKTLNGPGLLNQSYYTVTGASWISLTYVSQTELKVTGTPTSTGTYSVKVTGPIAQGGATAEWVWTINVINETTYNVTVYGRTGTVIGSANVTAGSTYTLPTLSDTETHTFKGYYTATSGGSYVGTSGTKITVNSDKAIYSQWTVITYYEIIMDLNGYAYHPHVQLYVTKATYDVKAGTSFSLSTLDDEIESGFIYSQSSGELENPTLLGWSTSPTGSVVSYTTFTANKNVTYYAIWGASEDEDLTFLGGTNSVIGVASSVFGKETLSHLKITQGLCVGNTHSIP